MAEKNRSRAEEIASAATRLFAERGYDGVSVRDICAELSVNCSIVSYYFGGKKGLYLEVLRREFKAYRQALSEAMAGGDSPKDKLSVFINVLGRMRHEYPHFSAIMVRESSSPSPEFIQAAKEYGGEDALADLIRDGQRLGQLKKGARADSLALALTLLLNGVAMARAFGPALQAEKDYNEAVTLLFDGMLVVPEDEGNPVRFGKQSAGSRTNWSR